MREYTVNESLIPDDLDRNTINNLKEYGYCYQLNHRHKSNRVRGAFIKDYFPYYYYFYIDIDINQEAFREADKLNINDFENPRKYYSAWNREVKKNKDKIIKERYNLSKKKLR